MRRSARFRPTALWPALFLLLLGVPLLAWGQDPFAEPGGGGAGAPPSVAGDGLAGGAGLGELTEQCQHITSALCAKQNLPLLAIAAGYVLVCVLLASLLRAFWNKRGSGGPGFRFWVPLLLAATAAGLLAGFDPFHGRDLACCLSDPVFAAEVFLQDSSVGRAFLLGVIPAGVLSFVVTFFVGLAKR